MTSADRDRNHLPTVLSLGYCTAAAVLLINLQPIFVGAAAEEFGFNEVQLGSILAGTLIASFLVFTTSLLWVNRIPLRVLIGGGALVGIAALFGVTFATGYYSVILPMIVYAIGMGMLYVPSLVALGRQPDPTRAFGVSITCTVILAALFAFVIPAWIEPRFGFDGTVGMILGATVLVFLVLPNLQSGSLAPQDEPSEPEGGVPFSAYLSLVGAGIYHIGILGIWAFLERIGSDAGISGEQIGAGFALALVCGSMGSLTAAAVSTRLRVPSALVISTCLAAASIALMRTDLTPITFGLVLILFNVAWNFTLPFMYEVIGKSDPSGRGLALAPAAMTLGSALGPLSAGFLLSASGVDAYQLQFVVMLALAYGAILVVERRVRG